MQSRKRNDAKATFSCHAETTFPDDCLSQHGNGELSDDGRRSQTRSEKHDAGTRGPSQIEDHFTEVLIEGDQDSAFTDRGGEDGIIIRARHPVSNPNEIDAGSLSGANRVRRHVLVGEKPGHQSYR